VIYSPSFIPQTSFYILSAFSSCSCWLLALENQGHRLSCNYRERFATEICRVRRAELRRLKVAETKQGRAWIWKPATEAGHSGILVFLVRSGPPSPIFNGYCGSRPSRRIYFTSTYMSNMAQLSESVPIW